MISTLRIFQTGVLNTRRRRGRFSRIRFYFTRLIDRPPSPDRCILNGTATSSLGGTKLLNLLNASTVRFSPSRGYSASQRSFIPTHIIHARVEARPVVCTREISRVRPAATVARHAHGPCGVFGPSAWPQWSLEHAH